MGSRCSVSQGAGLWHRVHRTIAPHNKVTLHCAQTALSSLLWRQGLMCIARILPSPTNVHIVHGNTLRSTDDKEVLRVAHALVLADIRGHTIALIDTEKNLYLVDLEHPTLVRKAACIKTPTSIALLGPRTVLVADKAGDVSQFVFGDTAVSTSVLLGHLSIVTALCTTETLLVSADRDEKIRSSLLATPFVIDRFLLGHAAYVASIAVVHEHTLASVDGDGVLKLWDLQTGCELDEMRTGLREPLALVVHGDRIAIAADGSSTMTLFRVKDHVLSLLQSIPFDSEVTACAFDTSGSLYVATVPAQVHLVHKDGGVSLLAVFPAVPEKLLRPDQLYRGHLRKDLARIRRNRHE